MWLAASIPAKLYCADRAEQVYYLMQYTKVPFCEPTGLGSDGKNGEEDKKTSKERFGKK
jgi:hypothetical protein